MSMHCSNELKFERKCLLEIWWRENHWLFQMIWVKKSCLQALGIMTQLSRLSYKIPIRKLWSRCLISIFYLIKWTNLFLSNSLIKWNQIIMSILKTRSSHIQPRFTFQILKRWHTILSSRLWTCRGPAIWGFRLGRLPVIMSRIFGISLPINQLLRRAKFSLIFVCPRRLMPWGRSKLYSKDNLGLRKRLWNLVDFQLNYDEGWEMDR